MKALIPIMVTCLLMAGVAATNIHLAVIEGNLAEVQRLLAEDPQLIDARDNTGKTPLHCATYNGQMQIAAYLIEEGADLNALTTSGSTPLHGAGFYGYKDAAGLLILKGANVNIANNYGYTPLLSTAAGGHLDIVMTLLNAGADKTARITQSQADALLAAGSSGNGELVEYLLTQGFDINAVDNTGEGLLHYASFGGNIELVKRLIDKGFDVNVRSNDGVTPLHYAAQNSHPEVVEYLIGKGADVNARDSENSNCLIKTITWSRNDTTGQTMATIRKLVENGAYINAANDFGQTPILWTVHARNIEAARYLIEQGAYLDSPTDEGITPLHAAINNGAPEFIELLAKNGASPEIGDKRNGYTAFHLAAIQGNLDVVAMLLPYIKDINLKDNYGKSAMCYACKYGHKKVADMLQAHGAVDKNLEKNFGYASDLTNKLGNKQAALWYLGHCGWAVKTSSHLLVFDFWNRGNCPTEPCLANGHLCPDELKNQNVTVFVSHEHQDHFDSTIFTCGKSIKNLTYVFGFHPENLPVDQRKGYSGQPYEYIDSHDSRVVDGMKITTITANDAGQGFLVEVDGLNIYFAGDHAGWREGQKAGFTDEIDFLSNKVKNLDFAFVNVTGCHVSDTVALAEATFYTIDKLAPKVLVPTHGIDREYVYKEYADKIYARGYNLEVITPEHRGDKYIYKNKQIM